MPGTYLITGATGSFGNAFTQFLFDNANPDKIIIYSRDEYKQSLMRERFKSKPGGPLRFFLGDVRDRHRLGMALNGVDTVIHAAALKRVDAGEYDPIEFIHTNIGGAERVIESCIARGVRRCVALSTDKACSPVNLYGATKLCAEKLFIAANSYTGGPPIFSVVRYGNVAGSRGSVIPTWRGLLKDGRRLPITDVRMTRFWMTMDEAVRFVWDSLHRPMGELHIPTIPSFKIVDLALAMGADSDKITLTGIRPGEKLHESLVGPDERIPGFGEYRSDTNEKWLSVSDIKKRLEDI